MTRQEALRRFLWTLLVFVLCVAFVMRVAVYSELPKYRTCLEPVRPEDPMPHVRRVTIESGLPRGTFVYDTDGIGEKHNLSGIGGVGWFEGPDEQYLWHEDLDFRPSPGGVQFTRRVRTIRPLPAGTYTIFPNEMWYGGMVCDQYPEIAKKREILELTVVASPGAVHEAFFSPREIGDAAGADLADGGLEPVAFSLDGVTTTITSLKWQDGVVTMDLNPPASLGGAVLEFIDRDGSVTVRLSSENASSTPLTWSVPDKPWPIGGLLMLRISR